MDVIAEISIRLGAAWLVGALIGIDRSYHDKPAGFRTYSLVALASAMLMSAMSFQHEWLIQEPAGQFTSDPMRVAQGILTGLGFLGAGTIFRERLAIRGLTTASSMWIAATLGILFGAGFYYPAIIGSVVTIVTLAALRGLERRLPSLEHALCEIRFPKSDNMGEDDLRALMRGHDIGVNDISYRLNDDGTGFEYHMLLTTANSTNFRHLSEQLCTVSNVRGFRISPTDD
jgi:putative Mg2+ transporter-C (MgtC) family protein